VVAEVAAVEVEEDQTFAHASRTTLVGAHAC
jgi:hypothetical protein